jgi:hypothetical protein
VVGSPLVGTWRLVRVEARSDAGRWWRPAEHDAAGRLRYGPDGRMALEITAARFPYADGSTAGGRFLAGRWHLAYRGTYDSYLDPFSPDNDRVVHHVESGSDPAWQGVDDERSIKLIGDVLTWQGASVRAGGGLWTMHLVWERVPGSAAGPPAA